MDEFEEEQYERWYYEKQLEDIQYDNYIAECQYEAMIQEQRADEAERRLFPLFFLKEKQDGSS